MNWTTYEIQYLEDHSHEGAEAIASALGRSRHAVEVQASRYGISLKLRWVCPHCGVTVFKPLSSITGWCHVCTKEANRARLANEVRQLEELAQRGRVEDRERQRLYTRRYRARQKLGRDND